MFQPGNVYSVLPTPFHPDHSIDHNSLVRVIELYLNAGVHGLTALGVTSETARLSDRERSEVLETVFKTVNGRVPVVVGATAGSLATCLEYSKTAIAAGASAVMVSPPRMPKLNSAAVLRHFHSLAEGIAVPIVVQDYPVVSGYAMEPALLIEIARDLPSARTIKLEDPPTPFKIARILDAAPEMGIHIFGGLGGMYLLEELMAGAIGAMTGFAYPEILVEVARLFFAGERTKAADFFYRFVSLMRFEFQQGIGMAIRKEMLKRRGALSHATIRPPGGGMDDSTNKALDQILQWAKEQGASWI